MKIVVSAGGTGGHIYPALTIIDKFREKEKDLEVIYIGTHNRMEKDIVPKRNIRYEELEIYGFSKKDIKRDLKNIILIRKAYKKCLKLMEEFKPDIVLGIGGYVTYPVIKADSKLGIKVFIHEQNSIPGKTNKALAKYATIIGVSFPDTNNVFPKNKTFLSGNPVATNAIVAKKYDKTILGFHENKKLVVIVSGSLGSSTINNKLISMIKEMKNKEYELLYITGENLYEEFTKNLEIPSNVKVVPYIDNLSSLLKSTDLVITRAGAGIMSECAALKLPTIFIPSPYVANNHQYYNALELKKKNCCELIEEKDLTSDLLLKTIDELFSDEKKLKTFKSNLNAVGITDSSERIYKKIKEVL